MNVFMSTESQEKLPEEHSDETNKDVQLIDIHPQHVPSANFKFPKRTFGDKGKRERSCIYQWFEEFRWVSYLVEKDLVICHYCYSAYTKSKQFFQRLLWTKCSILFFESLFLTTCYH